MGEYHELVKNTTAPSQLDELKAVKTATSTEPLTWPVAEIPSKDLELQPSENYRKIKAVIDEGIAASIAANLPMYMVKVWLPKTHLHEAKEIDVFLAEFLSGSNVNGVVSSEEYAALLNEYSPANEAYIAMHKKEIDALEAAELTADTSGKTIGRVAIARHRPAQSFKSGPNTYQDARKAAAHDVLDDEDDDK